MSWRMRRFLRFSDVMRESKYKCCSLRTSLRWEPQTCTDRRHSNGRENREILNRNNERRCQDKIRLSVAGNWNYWVQKSEYFGSLNIWTLPHHHPHHLHLADFKHFISQLLRLVLASPWSSFMIERRGAKMAYCANYKGHRPFSGLDQRELSPLLPFLHIFHTFPLPPEACWYYITT